jgi:hypothetical protein
VIVLVAIAVNVLTVLRRPDDASKWQPNGSLESAMRR